MPHLSPSTRILLASVLKPLNDTRMYGKFGRTLAARPQTQVHVAGRDAPAPADAPAGLHTHALLQGSRLSWARLGAQWRYWQLLRQLRPRLVVVHAPELLPLTLLWQALGRGRYFLYDVRENYALNIRTQQVYPAWLRGLLARAVRQLETRAAHRAARVLLAERSYADELPFAHPARTVVLENKFQPAPGAPLPRPRPWPAPAEPLQLLYSGTISELNGVFEAVAFVRALRQHRPARLTIIGCCQQPAVLARLRAAIAGDAAIRLIGGDTLVPHPAIVAAIGQSHLGLLPYRPHPSTWRCVPTKLFEYAAHCLPMLVPDNPQWLAALPGHGALLCCPDFASPPVPALLAALAGTPHYPAGPPPEAFWHSEAIKLRAVVDSIVELPTFAAR